MTKKIKQPATKSTRKSLLKEIEAKLTESIKGFHKKVSEKKLEKEIRRAGKILVKSLTTKEPIKVVHKEKVKTAKKDKKTPAKEVAS